MEINKNILPILLLLLMILLDSTSTRAQEVEDESDFDYFEESTMGPHHWGELRKEWEACKNGKMQSPIDLSIEKVNMILSSPELITNYKPCNATISNRGHDIAVYWNMGDAGSILINGTEYFLQQCHWHSPAEHTVNGRKYDLEMHLVHINPDPIKGNKLAVVSTLYRIGRPDPFLSKLEKEINHTVDVEVNREMGVKDPSQIMRRSKMYYSYIGSLTVPPCTEGVIWNIDWRIRTVSKEQVELLRHAVHDHAERNARPTQPHNKRDILLHLDFQYKEGARQRIKF